MLLLRQPACTELCPTLTVVHSRAQAIDTVTHNEMYFAALPLVHPRARREYSGRTTRAEPFTRSDLTLHSNVWASNVIGCLSPWYAATCTGPRRLCFDQTQRCHTLLAVGSHRN